ncbi:MAG: protein kinase [Deltaproteobacteria bacterium]|nr:protein kinase [Deltaproteobacteria bacterium]
MKKPIPFGKYYLLDRISVGGMAEVFKAKAFGVEGFERLIAVKRILPSIAEDEEFITMFIDEAKIAVQLQHANIAQIFDLGKVGDSYFIALEFVSGKDLRSIFDRMRNNGQAIPIPMAAYVTMKVCEGLDYAHNKKDAASRDLNLVHRDVSPQNVLISYDGEIKIIDFGIAKAAGKAGKTQAGILKGKFGYMSPEQVRGLPLDRRSDIFAVGICLWEIVTGERLFVGESDFSTLEKVRNVEITPPSTYNRRIPEDLEKIILKILSKEVEDRYQSAMDLHDDLQSWMYTSGNFFARKDLGGFMQEVFRAEIEKEAVTTEMSGEIVRSTVPPPPKARATGSGPGPSRPGAPPPPPPKTTSPGMHATSQPPPLPPMVRGATPSGPAPIAPVRTTPPAPRATAPGKRAAPPPGSMKRTMLGMPAPKTPDGSAPEKAPPPSTPTPPKLPGDLAGGMVATPAAPGMDGGIQMDDWDDDEPPTNIYSKETAAEMAQAAVAKSMPQSRSAPPTSLPPMAVNAPTFDDAPIDMTQELKEAKPTKRSSRVIPIAIAAVIILAAAVTAYFFIVGSGAGTLQLDVHPADNLTVVVDGSKELPGHHSPFKIFELESGKHVITIQRKGYKDEQVEITVKGNETLARRVSMKKAATGFFLETDPPGATVYVNDRPLDDKTPFTVDDLKEGTYQVRITKGETFAPKTLEVVVEAGKITELPVKKLDLKEVEITILSEPEGARATLFSGKDSKVVGLTPATTKIDTAKEYKVRLTKDGYTEITKTVDYPAGQEKVNLEVVKLWKVEKGTKPPRNFVRKPNKASTSGKPGLLSVQTRPWSRVFINGKFIKNTPLVNHKLKPGSYRVTVENSTYNIKRNYRVTIKPGKTTTLVKTLI